uniref:Uncharacterized protein n=1 Tax=Tanacetum cinerariifolium TaxID=118510 RepID=A0A699R0N3_TANCI|nr:hypothetical protein [Tanacetum cinerariifolium]
MLEAFLAGFHREHVAEPAGFEVIDGDGEAHALAAVAVAGEGKRRIGRRERGAAVQRAEAVEHVGPHHEVQAAVAGAYFLHLQAQQLAECVVPQHQLLHGFGRVVIDGQLRAHATKKLGDCALCGAAAGWRGSGHRGTRHTARRGWPALAAALARRPRPAGLWGS